MTEDGNNNDADDWDDRHYMMMNILSTNEETEDSEWMFHACLFLSFAWVRQSKKKNRPPEVQFVGSQREKEDREKAVNDFMLKVMRRQKERWFEEREEDEKKEVPTKERIFSQHQQQQQQLTWHTRSCVMQCHTIMMNIVGEKHTHRIEIILFLQDTSRRRSQRLKEEEEFAAL